MNTPNFYFYSNSPSNPVHDKNNQVRTSKSFKFDFKTSPEVSYIKPNNNNNHSKYSDGMSFESLYSSTEEKLDNNIAPEHNTAQSIEALGDDSICLSSLHDSQNLSGGKFLILLITKHCKAS